MLVVCVKLWLAAAAEMYISSQSFLVADVAGETDGVDGADARLGAEYLNYDRTERLPAFHRETVSEHVSRPPSTRVRTQTITYYNVLK